jgi:multidrug efflux system membrane fusion protein
MRLRNWILAIGAIAILGVAILGGRAVIINRRATPSVQQATIPSIPVVAGLVSTQDVPIYLHGIGNIIAYNTVTVRSQIQGQLTQIAFTEGQAVRAGDLLALIDPRPYQAQLDQMVANRDRDQAQLTNALANLKRDTELLGKGFATEQLSDTQKAQVAQLQSAVKADEALIEQSKVQLSYTRLTSPIPGITGVRQIDVGNVIHPTDPNGLVVVTQVEPISLIFTLPESDLPKIQERMAKAPLTVVAYSQDNKIKLDEGVLRLVNNQILQATGSIQLKAEFPNIAHRLWPGQLVNVRLLLETRTDGMTVAASAVQQNQKGSYVYVISSDGIARTRPVTVAQISEGQALIDTGLKPKENVVIDGQYRLQEGSHVRELHGKAAQEADLQSSVQKAIP